MNYKGKRASTTFNSNGTETNIKSIRNEEDKYEHQLFRSNYEVHLKNKIFLILYFKNEADTKNEIDNAAPTVAEKMSKEDLSKQREGLWYSLVPLVFI